MDFHLGGVMPFDFAQGCHLRGGTKTFLGDEQMKKWNTLSNFQFSNFPAKRDIYDNFQIEKMLNILLDNRGIKTKKERVEFLNPKIEDVTIEKAEIDKRQLQKAITRIQKAIKNKEKIVVFGDYDVDGICGTAILWETLHSLGADVMPYIPHRVDEGYGLSVKGIHNVTLNLFQDLASSGQNEMPKPASPKRKRGERVRHDNKKSLIITVDNGIVANKAVEFANKNGIDVIITDHHVPSKKLPDAYSVVHTTKLCGAGVAWMLGREIENRKLKIENSNGKWKMENGKFLELVALATIADLVPLLGANRALVKFGIEKLRQTSRIGLLELFKEAGLNQSEIGVYEIGHIIAPRLNAMGRLEYAMDSLRLLCTKNRERAKMLAEVLGTTNRERQELTIQTVEHAKSLVYSSSEAKRSREVLSEDGSRQARTIMQKLLFIADPSYQQGVIGLVAGKLVEEFYRPTIVVSIGEKYSKASARSVSGFNIIEFIRGASEFLIDAGGHPMAAGFTVETDRLTLLQKTLEEKASEVIDEEKLTRSLRIDCELPLSRVDSELYEEIQKLAPFGMGNPEPTFVSRRVMIGDMRLVGRENKHVKFIFSCHPERQRRISRDSSVASLPQNDKGRMIDGIAFGMGERAGKFSIGDIVDVVYTIDMDTWNGNKKLQLKIRDLRK